MKVKLLRTEVAILSDYFRYYSKLDRHLVVQYYYKYYYYYYYYVLSLRCCTDC
jgi:hypothetical protein